MENKSNPHHLVLGQLNDFLTGDVLPDTLDERYRQKIAKLLVNEKGFEKKGIENNITLEVVAGNRKALVKIDFLVIHKGKAVLLIKYAPGSLVTRRLSTLALSRITKPYQIPFAIITNGEDAEILDGISGKPVAAGLENLPDKKTIEKNMKNFIFEPVKPAKFDQASRIAYACEVDGACPCDSDVCIINQP